jgi:hypothetical protein
MADFTLKTMDTREIAERMNRTLKTPSGIADIPEEVEDACRVKFMKEIFDEFRHNIISTFQKPSIN